MKQHGVRIGSGSSSSPRSSATPVSSIASRSSTSWTASSTTRGCGSPCRGASTSASSSSTSTRRAWRRPSAGAGRGAATAWRSCRQAVRQVRGRDPRLRRRVRRARSIQRAARARRPGERPAEGRAGFPVGARGAAAAARLRRSSSQTMKGRPVVLGYYLTSDRDARTRARCRRPVLEPGTFAERPIEFTSWTGYGGNLATSRLPRRAPGTSTRSRTRTGSSARADARRVQGRVLRAAVARDGAHAARVSAGQSPVTLPGSVLNRHMPASSGSRSGRCASRSTTTHAPWCRTAAERAASTTVARRRVSRQGRPSSASRARSRWWARPRRGCSTCGRRRSARSIRGSRSTPT